MWLGRGGLRTASLPLHTPVFHASVFVCAASLPLHTLVFHASACVRARFGSYATELEAAVAYDKLVRTRQGVTPLNFPNKTNMDLDAMIEEAKVRRVRCKCKCTCVFIGPLKRY